MPRDPIGDVVRNLFSLQQLGNGIGAEADNLLRELFDDIAARIARVDPTSPANPATRSRLVEEIMDFTGLRVGETLEVVRSRLETELVEIGLQQSEWAADHLQVWIGSGAAGGVGVDIATSTIGRPLVASIVTSRPFEGATLSQWAERQTAATVFNVRRQIQLGMAESETIDDIIRRIRGRSTGRAGQFTGGVLETTTRQATALVRTAVNHVANEAHWETYRANEDVTEKYRYTATLDSRTSNICISLDGREWSYDDPDAKRPPQHFNCRSVITPVIDWKGLGIEPPEEGTRAAQAGQVSAETTYGGWLRDQSKSVQDEILGPARAKLFRAGKLSLRDLVTRDNRVRTVEELRELAA